MKEEWTITIPNPIYRMLFRIRYNRAVKKWNAEIGNYIDPDTSPDDTFKWGHLVWQEIDMWIRQASKKTVTDEFQWMCDRRGFNDAQRAFLKSMLEHVWLWEDTK